MKRQNQGAAVRLWLVVGGALVGAAGGVLLAPSTGARTRRLLLERFRRVQRDAWRKSLGKARHLRNRAQGVVHNATKLNQQSFPMGSESDLAKPQNI